MIELTEVEVGAEQHELETSDKPTTKTSKVRRSTYKTARGAEITFPVHLRATSNVFTYTDPDRGVRFSSSPTLVESAPEKGTWLATQIEAGIIGE